MWWILYSVLREVPFMVHRLWDNVLVKLKEGLQ